MDREHGGLGGSVIIIDTENTFRPERITQMVEGLSEKYGMELNPEEFLQNIHVARATIPITRYFLLTLQPI